MVHHCTSHGSMSWLKLVFTSRPTAIRNTQIDVWDFFPPKPALVDFSPQLNLLSLDENLEFTQTIKPESHQPKLVLTISMPTTDKVVQRCSNSKSKLSTASMCLVEKGLESSGDASQPVPNESYKVLGCSWVVADKDRQITAHYLEVTKCKC